MNGLNSPNPCFSGGANCALNRFMTDYFKHNNKLVVIKISLSVLDTFQMEHNWLVLPSRKSLSHFCRTKKFFSFFWAEEKDIWPFYFTRSCVNLSLRDRDLFSKVSLFTFKHFYLSFPTKIFSLFFAVNRTINII